MQLDVPNRYLALSPVIITAPTARCGTTLVQRLLCTGDNSFLYGEEVGLHIRTLTGYLIGLIQQFERGGAAADAEFERALSGDQANWSPGLMPPTPVMLKAWTETYYQIPSALADYGASIGRPVWGFKGPDYARDMLRAFLMLMPKARILYVFRDLHEALKSAKARRFVTSDDDVAAFCAKWATNLREASDLRADARVLFLKYEDLIADRAATVAAVEAFTGAAGLKADVFDVKVNTFKGDEARGFSPTQYIAPAELTASDRAAITAHAGSVMAMLYPTG
jgi:Sulfotransferase family